MIPDYPANREISIPEQGTWPASVHVLHESTVAALQAAEATGRPLLVRGLPGVGKSETARAAAAFSNRPFLPIVLDGRTEPDDLKWRMDTVKRLSDAQGKRAREELEYVRPELLWWAFDWNGAASQARLANVPIAEGLGPAQWRPGQDRTVVLLDEIDKADPDLPNALLEVLANKGFVLPFTGAPRVSCSDSTRPLVVITTNEERELPAAFLRRCLVLTLKLPEGEVDLRDYWVSLAARHEAHERQREGVPGGARVSGDVLAEAAEAVLALRRHAKVSGDYMPGTSEFLDLVRALATLHPSDAVTQRQKIVLLSGLVAKSMQPDLY